MAVPHKTPSQGFPKVLELQKNHQKLPAISLNTFCRIIGGISKRGMQCCDCASPVFCKYLRLASKQIENGPNIIYRRIGRPVGSSCVAFHYQLEIRLCQRRNECPFQFFLRLIGMCRKAKWHFLPFQIYFNCLVNNLMEFYI